MKKALSELFQAYYGVGVDSIDELPRAGSHRRYFRMSGSGQVCVGAYSPDALETKAFITFTLHFIDKGLNVPQLLADEPAKAVYLLEDLGDLSIKELLDKQRTGSEIPSGVVDLYRRALEELVRFQTDGHEELDYSVCVPRKEFDMQSILWDLNHFKYYFLKLMGIQFDEQKLEDDFQTFTDHLLEAGRDYFMFRDFQSRNIMVRGDELYFIDYQGGRRGALQYDVASLLFEARTNLPISLREELLEHYLGSLRGKYPGQSDVFMDQYYGFVLVRILQALGAYGIRGIIENKALFLQSIPYALRNLEWLRDSGLIPQGMPELNSCIDLICKLEEFREMSDDYGGKLRITIHSFSYRKGMPKDLTGNGGGFVFDCRALPNPHYHKELKDLTGRDNAVREFLEAKPSVGQFIQDSRDMVSRAIESYLSLGYTELMVSFGCTGGRHRSVYCAEKLRESLNSQGKVETRLQHKLLE